MSVTSITDIANLSLDLLTAGTVQDIENPSDATESMLARWYDVTRKKLLRSHPWNFAIKRAILAANAEAPLFGYLSQFPLPNDFVRVLSVQDTNGIDIASSRYEMESGALLYNADAGQLRLRYVYDITDVTKFDAMFVDLLAIDLATAIAFKVTASNSDVERLAGLRKAAMAAARAIDGQERPPTRREESKALQERRQSVSTNSHRVIF